MIQYVLMAYRFGGYTEDPLIIGIEEDPEVAEKKAVDYISRRGGKYSVAIKIVEDGAEIGTHKYFPHFPHLTIEPRQFFSGPRLPDEAEFPYYEVLWLDDERNPSDPEHRINLEHYGQYKVTWVKTYEEFVAILTTQKWDGISFDNDLGTEKEGSHAFNYLEELIMTEKYVPPVDFDLQVHSANGSAADRIKAGIENLKKYLAKVSNTIKESE